MMLVDVHAHMDFEEFMGQKIDIDDVIERCKSNGVAAIVTQGVHMESNRKALEMASRHNIIKVALGIYPTHCHEMISQGKQKEFEEEIRFIDSQLGSKKAIAIGEVGLEYKEIEPTAENTDIMKTCLLRFIDLAKKHNVPIILHSRGAELELIDFLEHNGMKDHKVVMHCFSGRKNHIKRIVENGWFLTIPSNVVRLEHFQYIAQDVPISQLLTETDSPYLSPIVGKINNPSNVLYSIKKIAELKKMDENEVANIVYNNYQRLFL